MNSAPAELRLPEEFPMPLNQDDSDYSGGANAAPPTQPARTPNYYAARPRARARQPAPVDPEALKLKAQFEYLKAAGQLDQAAVVGQQLQKKGWEFGIGTGGYPYVKARSGGRGRRPHRNSCVCAV